MTSTDSEVYGNSANLDGGGIYIYDNTLAFHGGEILSNTAGRNGGGLFVATGTATLDDGASINSNAAEQGGGIPVAATGTVTVSYCYLQNNTASIAVPGFAYEMTAIATMTNTPNQSMEGV
jgi:hypothetical protein